MNYQYAPIFSPDKVLPLPPYGFVGLVLLVQTQLPLLLLFPFNGLLHLVDEGVG